MDSAEPRLLLALARRPTSLVVGHYQLALLVEFETVDDPPETQRLDRAVRPLRLAQAVLRHRPCTGHCRAQHGGLLENDAMYAPVLGAAGGQADVGLEPKLGAYDPDGIGVLEHEIVAQQFMCVLD